MSNFIVTKNKRFFTKIGNYHYCKLEDIILPDTIAVDLETLGLNALTDAVFSIQIGTGTNNYLIDLQAYDTPLDKGKQIYIEEVLPYLKDKTLVFHNAAFDIGFLYVKKFFPDNVRDTMLASKILHNGEPPNVTHGFGAVMERELGIQYDKSEQKNIHKTKLSNAKAIQYCFNDVDRLLELHSNLLNKLGAYEAVETYMLNCNFIKSMVYMELCGLPINETKWREKMQQDELNSKQCAAQIVEYIYKHLPKYRKRQLTLFEQHHEITPLLSSPAQMLPVFRDLEINTIDDKGKNSINEKVINKTKHEFVDLWLKYKEAEQRISTFGQNVLNQVVNQRVYSRFNPIVDTNRISARGGVINFLNFPRDKETRSCFEARKGWVIVGCDYDGQENTTTTFLSRDKEMLDNILNKRDMHSKLCRYIFLELKDFTDKQIKEEHGEKRQVAKVVGLAISYGGNASTIAKNLNMEESEAQRIYEVYMNLYADVFVWGRKKLEEALKLGWIESTDGFKLKLPFYKEFLQSERMLKEIDWEIYREGKQEYILQKETEEKRKEDKTISSYIVNNTKSYHYYLKHKQTVSEYFQRKSSYQRLCLNNPSQGLAAHQSKRAMWKLFEYIKEHNHLGKARIVNFIYDEILMEVKEELAEEYRMVLETTMRDAANHYLNDGFVHQTCTGVVGSNWYSTK